MAEAFDKDGNPIEGIFTKEEVDAQVEAARVAATEEAKKAPTDGGAAPDTKDEPPAWAKDLISQVQAITTGQKDTVLSKVTTGLDVDQAKLVKEKYDNLAGYAETPEGIARRSEDAYLLATGQKFEGNAVNMANLASVGGKVGGGGAPVAEVDKQINQALGNSPEDVAKYGKK